MAYHPAREGAEEEKRIIAPFFYAQCLEFSTFQSKRLTHALVRRTPLDVQGGAVVVKRKYNVRLESSSRGSSFATDKTELVPGCVRETAGRDNGNLVNSCASLII